MRAISLLGFSLLVAFFVASPRPAEAVVIGQVDTFQDGTTMGWFVPGASPAPPANVASGGPAGAADAFLRLAAVGGAGPGSRFSGLNESQWAGDYLAAGVAVIRMDVNNFGPDELHLRLLFEDFDGAGPPANLALSANAVIVPAGSGWISVQFPIAPADLVIDTFGTMMGALADTDILRLFHNPAPTFPGPGLGIPTVSATLGVDNITAQAASTPVSTPAMLPLIIAGLMGLLVVRSPH